MTHAKGVKKDVYGILIKTHFIKVSMGIDVHVHVINAQKGSK